MPSKSEPPPGRDLASVVFEVDYWRALLDEIGTINHALVSIADAVVSVQIECLTLILVPEGEAVFDRVRALTEQALTGIEQAQPALERMGELANGRALALKHEAGIAP